MIGGIILVDDARHVPLERDGVRRLKICFGNREVPVTDRLRRVIGMLIALRHRIHEIRTGRIEIHLSDGDVKVDLHITERRSDAQIARAIQESLGGTVE